LELKRTKLNRVHALKRMAVGKVAAAAIVLVALVAFSGLLSYQEGSGSGTGRLSDGLSMIEDSLGMLSVGGVAQVQIASVGLIADTFTGATAISPTCSTSPKNSYIQLTNTGSAKGVAKSVEITYGGSNNDFTIDGTCSIGPSGSPNATIYVLFQGPSRLPNSSVPGPSVPYIGSVVLNNGARLPFTGSFFQGSPRISSTAVVIAASHLDESRPANTTCSSSPPASDAYIALRNSGTVGSNVSRVTLDWNNTSSVFPITGYCTLGPDGTPSAVTYVTLGTPSGPPVAAKSGEAFSGTVAFYKGSTVAINGSFQ
jgi:hypothetical protein